MEWLSPQSSRSTRARRHPPRTFERLEDRALLSGDLLLTAQVPGQIVYHLLRYTQSGSQLNNVLIPQPPGSTEYQDLRGLTVDPSGNVNIYDGTFTPYLDTLKPANSTWSYQTYPGWSTVNNISYGEVAAYKNYVFASDMFTYNGGEPNGIVRFDTSDGLTVRFAQGTDFIQVALGLDGLIYGLGGSGDVHVFNPDTLAPVRTFSLSGGPDSDIRSIAVDVTGHVLGADLGRVRRQVRPERQLPGEHPAQGPVRVRREPDQHRASTPTAKSLLAAASARSTSPTSRWLPSRRSRRTSGSCSSRSTTTSALCPKT